MEECLKIIFTKTTNKLDRIKAYEIQIQAYAVQHRFLDAIAIACTALKEFNLNLPETVTSADTIAALKEVQDLLGNKTTDDLLNLPAMIDAEALAIASLLFKTTPAIYICKPYLYPLVILIQVKQLILYGKNSNIAYIYAAYGALKNIILEDICAAYEFGNLALQMLGHLNHYNRSKVNLVVAQSNLNCKQHYRDSLPLLIEGYQVGMAVGDREFAGYNAGFAIHCAYLTGVNLKTVIDDAQAYIQQLQKFNLLSALDLANIAIFAVRDLENFLDKAVVKSQKEEFYSRIHKTGSLNGLCLYWFYEMIHEYLCDRREEANQANVHVHQTIVSFAGTIFIPLFHFYDSLVALNNYPHCTDENGKEEILERVKNNQQKLLHRAHHAPMNFQHKYDLVAAEMHRILGNIPEAMQMYDEAIQGAVAHDYIQEAALANERAAEFYLEINKPKIAWIYLQDAHQYYQEWGAKVKVQQLETKYSQLFNLKSQSSNYLPRNLTQTFTQTRGSSSTAIQLLDLGTVMRAATAISSEIILEKLLHKLLQIILENAGAQKGCIILEQDGDLYVEVADCNQEIREVVVNKVSLETSESFPVELIQYVVRTQEPLILNNAAKEGMFINNPYIVKNQPKSILCLPIFSQGKFLGLVYLENNLLKAAFTSDRLEVVKVLTSQAAIAIENAQLYSREQEKAKELTQKEQQYRSIFESVNDGLGIWDLETGECLAVNPANCRMYGYSQEEFLKITAADFVHPDYLHVFTESLQAVTAGKDFYGHAIVIRKDGSQFDIEVRGTRCFYNGKYQGLFIGRDISQQKAAEREKVRAEAEIKRKNQELEQALMQLQQSQAQVIQSEKMSALGNLVAGVAHEINNPISFLNGSIKNAQDYIRDILGHLQLYQEQVEATSVIQESAEEIDLEFLMEDLPKILLGMQTATERIKNISNSLRTFSRADTEHKVTANIHDGLESTLLILKYRLKANEHRPAIEVIREYGDLPPIECFPGQLNQVFMNILANAIDMFDEVSQNQSMEELKAHPQRICISTSMADEELQIRIRDNGKGMTPEIQSKIFEHLFTTKGVGKGTGLGLAIAKQIIEETHAGKLTCVSHLGQGTEFIITIPTK
ncbi:GAF domain-containing sensor histidine kinase [Calothrix sp. NIES-3974]|uniref:GAF domain-containing sensor histidine kinase n=1 Tax=Calothrix sp. NIES-3974 TaxID=2005462 RepID=UPI000B61210B|nr:ATP-binding protein [Calothrix sp. NIES-3974]BAZ03962.1 serine/threonine protein kinase with two-component sensor domain [Calothrix sp. NIES-3974]